MSSLLSGRGTPDRPGMPGNTLRTACTRSRNSTVSGTVGMPPCVRMRGAVGIKNRLRFIVDKTEAHGIMIKKGAATAVSPKDKSN